MRPYAFDVAYIVAALPALGSGLRLTLAVSAVGILGALVVGLAGGAVRAARAPVLGGVVGIYVELMRNTPLVVQLFFLYFGLPEIGVTLSAFTVGCLGLVLWGGAYHTENFRAGLEAVGRGHREAAWALGLSEWTAFWGVVLPIGARIAIPSLTNTCISVLKSSSFLVVISLPELMTTAVGLVALSFRVFEVFVAVAALYLGLVWALSGAMALVERRLALPEGA